MELHFVAAQVYYARHMYEYTIESGNWDNERHYGPARKISLNGGRNISKNIYEQANFRQLLKYVLFEKQFYHICTYVQSYHWKVDTYVH